MGNTVVKDFHNVKVSKFEPSNSMMLFPEEDTKSSSTTVLLRGDPNRKGNTIAFDLSSMIPLYVTETKKQKNKQGEKLKASVTKDRFGNILFITSTPSKNKQMIYRVPKNKMETHSFSHADALDYTSCSSSESLDDAMDKELSMFDEEDRQSLPLSAGLIPRTKKSFAFDHDLACSAEIDIDTSGAAVTASLNMVVWKGSGPESLQLYKAIRIPNVKYGVLVVDCPRDSEQEQRVVAKACLDEKRMEPSIQIARGTDVPAVVALVSSLIGDL